MTQIGGCCAGGRCAGGCQVVPGAVTGGRGRNGVGRSTTVKAIMGQMIAPGYADRYLAKAGYEGQYTDQPHDSRRPSNLMAPVEGDHGAHGTFDARVHYDLKTNTGG